MAAYVDQLQPWPKTKRWPYRSVSHLFADAEEELIAFGLSIALRRSWLQHGGGGHLRVVHFDLTAGKRAEAVARGAIELDPKATVVKWYEIRYGEDRTNWPKTAREAFDKGTDDGDLR